jgi:hypothetical protein
MERTGLQVITDALKLLGVVAGHEVPTAAEQQDALSRLNELIDGWQLHAHLLYVTHRETLTLVPDQQVYTVGVGGDVDVVAPVDLAAVSWLTSDSVPVEVYLTLGTEASYVGQPVKTLTGATPQTVSYARGAPLGTLWVWPVPAVAVDLVLYWREAVEAFPDLVTPVALLPGLAKALRTNLAVELAPEFGRPLDPLVLKLAGESLADVKRANLPFVEIGIDPALTGCGPSYNILTDT